VSLKFAYNDRRYIKCRYIPILYLDVSNKHFPKNVVISSKFYYI